MGPPLDQPTFEFLCGGQFDKSKVLWLENGLVESRYLENVIS